MHPDTLALIALHKSDLQREGIVSKMNSINRELDNAQAKVDSAKAKIQALQAEMVLLNQQEKEHSIRYERYLKKAADTERKAKL